LDEFKIIFRHRSMTEQEGAGYSKSNVEEAISDYFTKRESVSKSEIARAAGISPKTAMVYVNRLIDEGIVEGIGSRNSPKRRYRMS
ncbi:MAG: winged helix-turn-helix domain-containing protein, partial [Raoultibacter sp.]